MEEEYKILVETSARHIHLDQATFDYLMGVEEGKHAELEIKKMLSQPGQYVSNTRLNLIGEVNPKNGKPRMLNHQGGGFQRTVSYNVGIYEK